MTDKIEKIRQRWTDNGILVREGYPEQFMAYEHVTALLAEIDRLNGRIDPSTIRPGLYKIYWKSGGSSHAAVGIANNGDRWIAGTNWVENISTDWGDVAAIHPIASNEEP